MIVVDDDIDYASTWRDRLVAEGFDVQIARNAAEVRHSLASAAFPIDVMFLDIYLGPTQQPSLDILVDTLTIAPKTQVLLLTGGTTDDVAFSMSKYGASDYIRKTRLAEPDGVSFLRDKIKETIVRPRDQHQLAALRAELIRYYWARLNTGTTNERGRKLEYLAGLLFASTGCFDTDFQWRGKNFEIDVVARYQGERLFWERLGPVFPIECKNWSKDTPETYHCVALLHKIAVFGTVSRCGFFFSLTGFSEGFQDEVRVAARSGQHIVPIGLNEIAALCIASSPLERIDILEDITFKSMKR